MSGHLVVVVIPMPVMVKIVVAGHIVIVVAVAVVPAGVIVPMAGVMPHMSTTPVAVVIGVVGIPAVVTISSAVPPVVTVRIADIEMDSTSSDVNPLRLDFVGIDRCETNGQHCRTQNADASHIVTLFHANDHVPPGLKVSKCQTRASS
jgi:hypothetical protein